MTTINIDKRSVPAKSRNNRIYTTNGIALSSNSVNSNTLTSGLFLKKDSSFNNYIWDLPMVDSSGGLLFNYDSSSDTIKFNKTITSVGDVIAYAVGDVSTSVFDGLSALLPLYKPSSTSLSLLYDPSSFSIDASLGLTFIGTAGGGGTTDWNDITSMPNFAIVSSTGSYNDLIDKPTIYSTIASLTDVASYFTGTKALTASVADQANAVTWNNVAFKPIFATVATSGSYTDLTNKPTIYTTIAAMSDVTTYFSGTRAKAAIDASTVTSVAWSKVTSTPTTLSGYGINNGVTNNTSETIGGVKTFSSTIVGNISGNAGTATTAGTVTTAAQPAITSLGVLTSLQVDQIYINANGINSTGGTNLVLTPYSGMSTIIDGITSVNVNSTETFKVYDDNANGLEIGIAATAGSFHASSAIGDVVARRIGTLSGKRLIIGSTYTKSSSATGIIQIQAHTTNDGTGLFVHNNGTVSIGSATAPGSTETLKVTGNILATAEITAYSDRRLKKEVYPTDDVLDKIQRVRVVDYKMIGGDDRKKTGVIAQELYDVFPQFVNGSNDEYYSVNYQQLAVMSIKAIQELTAKVEMLENKLNEIK